MKLYCEQEGKTCTDKPQYYLKVLKVNNISLQSRFAGELWVLAFIWIQLDANHPPDHVNSLLETGQ